MPNVNAYNPSIIEVTSKRRPVLIDHDEFIYTFHKKRYEKKYWRCMENMWHGRVYIISDQVVFESQNHSHISSTSKIETVKRLA